ncbi:hypothetical protein NBZ79_06570 [Sneathiella marina]|uniref:Uncharacterized protein n=1 Tax=Sneathiella marina TaxID=2950108 RepID=A0ABY4W760_9PROT|nr:hypothetical protein [Sneathiella marina]USG62639.1 hypothetical protein NBZ79_06570 [Sneathiella marina]
MTCRLMVITFAVLYAVAISLFLVGTFDWFELQTGPLAGLLLIPLGLPWSLIEAPDAIRLPLGIGAPFLNLVILWVACRLIRKRNL